MLNPRLDPQEPFLIKLWNHSSVKPALQDMLNKEFNDRFQVSGRKNLESSLRQLEREKALLQHKSLESHRKAESEADRKRCLENEGDMRLVDK